MVALVILMTGCVGGAAATGWTPALAAAPDASPEARLADFEDKTRRLEEIIKALGESDPDYPEYLLELAVVYGQEADYLARLVDARAEEIREARDAGDEDAAAQLEEERDIFARDEKHSRSKSARILAAVVDNPKFAGFEDMDEALYRYAVEHDVLGEEIKAQAAFQRLINDHPDSPRRPSAYLYFADHYFSTQNYPVAALLYDTVLGLEDRSLHAYCLHQLGSSYARAPRADMERQERSLGYFIEAIEATRDSERTRSEEEARALRRSARLGLSEPYSWVRDPAEAWALFVEVGRGPEQEDETRAMMEALAVAYAKAAKWDASTLIYDALQAHFEGEADVCAWQAAIIENHRHGCDEPELRAAEGVYAERCSAHGPREPSSCAPSPSEPSSELEPEAPWLEDSADPLSPRPPPPRPPATGRKLNSSQIIEVIDTIRPGVDRCFDSVGARAPHIAMTVTVEGATGRVLVAEVRNDPEGGGTRLEACVAEQLMEAEFPIFESERQAFTFRFRRPGSEP